MFEIILLCLQFLYQNKVIHLKENNKVWAALGYDQNGSILIRNPEPEFWYTNFQLIFRIISGLAKPEPEF